MPVIAGHNNQSIGENTGINITAIDNAMYITEKIPMLTKSFVFNFDSFI